MKMLTPEDELRALDLFERLLAYPGNDRFRARLLKREVPSVLVALARIEAGHAARAAMQTEFPEALPGAQLAPPERIGPFRLTTRIGQGGMGDVWRGERDDGLFEQSVAIKLIHANLGSRAQEAFDVERRILARLDHPDIVRLTDGGVTETGLPYLIMDLVEGVAFDEAVASLSYAQRIRLIIQACNVVQFAHSRFVAHADLKPSNIMVDTQGRVRLLDFGIAGLLGGEGEMRPPPGAMTREFASPQRIAGAAPSIADDVYAIGRMLETITADAPDKDMASIAAKASAHEEADRYDTVAALISDLSRWQEGKTVTAHDGGLAYRVRKFVARHRFGVAASAIAISALLGTTAYAVVSANRAEHARAEAEQRFGEVRSMAKFMLFDLYNQVSGIPGTTRARAEMSQVSQQYLSSLAQNPDAPFDLKVEAAEGFVRVAEIAGATGSPNLADAKLAISYLARADKMTSDMLKTAPDSPILKQLLGKVAALQCQMKLYGDHDAKAALDHTVKAEATMGPVFVAGPLNEGVWRARLCHGDALVWLNRSDEAIPILAGELARAEKTRATRPAAVDTLRLAYNYRLLGEAYYYKPDMPSAVKQLEKAYAILSDALDQEPTNVRYTGSFLNVIDTLASAYTHTGQSAEGLKASEAGYRFAMQSYERDKADMNSLKSGLALARLVANFNARLGKFGTAKSLMANVEMRWQALLRQSPDQAALYRLYILSLIPHAQVYRLSGDTKTACSYFRRAAQEWAYFDRRWKLSPSDKTEDVAYAEQAVRACEGKGKLPDP